MDSSAAVKCQDRQTQQIWHGSAREIHNRGLALYRNKEYDAARLCFTQVINGEYQDMIKVLDNRSAAYIKLGNHEAALLDGQKMIRQDKTDVTGYLRTGKVLWLMGKTTKAKEIYERGLGRVQSTNPNIGLLRGVYAKAVEQMDPPRRLDPFQTLPLEVAELVLSSLEFTDLCSCASVSKPWLDLLESIPTLWTNLNFIAAKQPVQEGAIRKYIKRGRGLPTRVTLPKNGTYANSKCNLPRFLVTRCSGLYELIIPGGLVGETMLQAAPCATNLKNLIIGGGCRVTNDTVDQLLEHGKALERAEFYNVFVVTGRPALFNGGMSRLQSLVLIFSVERIRAISPKLQVIDIEKLVKKIPNIRKLTLRSNWTLPAARPGQEPMTPDFSTLKQLEDLDINGMDAMRGPKLPAPSLQRLDVSDNSFPVIDIDSRPFPKLTRLSFAHSYTALHYGHIRTMLEANKGNLTHLDASGMVSDIFLEELIMSGYLQGTEELKLELCSVNDEHLAMLAEHAPNIKRLSVKGTKVSGVGVKTLVTALAGKLEFICLDLCHRCSPDAHAWATSMGVKTSFKFPESRWGGRKVRQ